MRKMLLFAADQRPKILHNLLTPKFVMFTCCNFAFYQGYLVFRESCRKIVK